jgi:hypothetical protein
MAKIVTLSALKIQEFESLVPTIPTPHDPNALFGSPPAGDCQHRARKFVAAAVMAGIIEITK